jgi:hypothetical protein
MKKLFFLVMVAAIFASCQKTEENAAPATQDVIFSGIDVTGNGQKSTDVTPCGDLLADYAHVVIDGVTYTPEVFYLDGIAYTQAIKLAPATYEIGAFALVNNNGTPQEMSDDIIVMASPTVGAEYAEFVNTPLSFTFTVEAFRKAEVNVEVLCFDEAEYDSFGFNWFALEEVTVREQVFFGDFCVKHPADYDGSLYEQQANGVQIDMPAIFEIDVYRNGEFLKTYSNEGWLGEGEPLKVQYPDRDLVEDEFEFVLRILVKEGSQFNYVHFHTWTFSDADMIDAGTDGVVDFVLGNCNLTDTDLQLAPYQNLPARVRLDIRNPGSLPSYWDVEVKATDPNDNGYDFGNVGDPKWQGWCADKNHTIGQGAQWFNVYSSLKPFSWPTSAPLMAGTQEQIKAKVAALNWLFNNLDLFATELGVNIQVIEQMPHNAAGEAAGDILQNVIWKITNGTNVGATATSIATTAMEITEYTPLPGGYAAVFLVKENNPNAQLLFVQVDP